MSEFNLCNFIEEIYKDPRLETDNMLDFLYNSIENTSFLLEQEQQNIIEAQTIYNEFIIEKARSLSIDMTNKPISVLSLFDKLENVKFNGIELIALDLKKSIALIKIIKLITDNKKQINNSTDRDIIIRNLDILCFHNMDNFVICKDLVDIYFNIFNNEIENVKVVEEQTEAEQHEEAAAEAEAAVAEQTEAEQPEATESEQGSFLKFLNTFFKKINEIKNTTNKVKPVDIKNYLSTITKIKQNAKFFYAHHKFQEPANDELPIVLEKKYSLIKHIISDLFSPEMEIKSGGSIIFGEHKDLIIFILLQKLFHFENLLNILENLNDIQLQMTTGAPQVHENMLQYFDENATHFKAHKSELSNIVSSPSNFSLNPRINNFKKIIDNINIFLKNYDQNYKVVNSSPPKKFFTSIKKNLKKQGNKEFQQSITKKINDYFDDIKVFSFFVEQKTSFITDITKSIMTLVEEGNYLEEAEDIRNRIIKENKPIEESINEVEVLPGITIKSEDYDKKSYLIPIEIDKNKLWLKIFTEPNEHTNDYAEVSCYFIMNLCRNTNFFKFLPISNEITKINIYDLENITHNSKYFNDTNFNYITTTHNNTLKFIISKKNLRTYINKFSLVKPATMKSQEDVLTPGNDGFYTIVELTDNVYYIQVSFNHIDSCGIDDYLHKVIACFYVFKSSIKDINTVVAHTQGDNYKWQANTTTQTTSKDRSSQHIYKWENNKNMWKVHKP